MSQKCHVTHEMNDSGCCEPDGDEDGDELCESNGRRSFEDVEVLEDVGDGHEAESPQEPEPDPRPVQVDGDERGRDREVVDE
jgi:hypothetical protein